MKKFAVLAALALAVLVPAADVFAADYGAVLSFGTDFKFDADDYSSPKVEQTETLTPYIKVPFGDSMYFAAELSVQHKLNAKIGTDSTTNAAILDLSLLKFNKLFKLSSSSSLTLSLGRMFVSDSTGLVFCQPDDVLFVKYSSPKIEAGACVGYSGLLNMKNVSILSSNGNLFTLAKEHILYDFAAPYITATASVAAPYLFANQTLSFEVMAFIPTQGPSKLPDNEETRFYATAMLSGPVSKDVFYSVFATVEALDFKKAALLSKFTLNYFAPVKNISAAFSAVYASGSNGGLVPFTGFTKMVSCLSATEPFYSGIIKTGFTASIVPVKPLFVSLGVHAAFTAMEKVEYYGTEIAAALKWQPFSDLQFTFGASTFIAKDSAANRTDLKLGGALAF